MDEFKIACLSALVKNLPISETKNETFIKACDAGHLDVIKWMSIIVDSKTHNQALWRICENNNLETAKFLYSLGIAQFNEFMIMHICERGYFDMVK